MLCELELVAQMRGFVVTDGASKAYGEEKGKALSTLPNLHPEMLATHVITLGFTGVT